MKANATSGQVAEIQSLVESKSKQLNELLSDLLQSRSVIMIGENHIYSEAELQKQVLASMMKELKDNGLTLLALEINSEHQKFIDDLDLSQNDHLLVDQLSSQINGMLQAEYWALMVVAAKRACLEVVAINESSYVLGALVREAKIQDNFVKALRLEERPTARALIYIGNDHIHKRPVGYLSKANPLGSRLAQQWGPERVASIRSLYPKSSLSGIASDEIGLKDLLPRGRGHLQIVPNLGAFSGDPRMVSADYHLIINP